MQRDLLQTQKNDVSRLIKESGLPLGQFRWEWTMKDYKYLMDALEADEWPVLRYGNTGFYFAFPWAADERKVVWSPGLLGNQSMHNVAFWNEVPELIGHWLKRVREEVEAPDLWAIFAAEEGGITLEMPSADNDFLDRNEAQALINKLHDWPPVIQRALEIQDERLEEVAGHVRELKVAVERQIDGQGRLYKKDLLMLFMGWLFSFSSDMMVSPDKWQRLFTTATGAARWIQTLLQ